MYISIQPLRDNTGANSLIRFTERPASFHSRESSCVLLSYCLFLNTQCLCLDREPYRRIHSWPIARSLIFTADDSLPLPLQVHHFKKNPVFEILTALGPRSQSVLSADYLTACRVPVRSISTAPHPRLDRLDILLATSVAGRHSTDTRPTLDPIFDDQSIGRLNISTSAFLGVSAFRRALSPVKPSKSLRWLPLQFPSQWGPP